jgi:hypothetical protein
MRYHELIIETAEENQIINLVSRAAGSTVSDMIRRKIPDFDTNQTIDYSELSDAGYDINNMNIPSIESPDVQQALRDLKIVLRYEPHKSNDLDMGGYAPKSHAIILNVPDIKTWSQHKNRSFDDVVQQTLVHEIQHAVDKTKSDGKALKRNANTASASSDFSGYLNLPHEINARFSEALLDISRVVANWREQGVKTTTNDLVKLIKQKFSQNRLDKLEGEKLKRLYSRVYQFYQAEMNSPKSIEADSLTTRAKNWIMGKKTVGTVR